MKITPSARATRRFECRVDREHAEEVLRAHGVPIQIRVGVNSGEVVVRAIGSDLHMDYTAIGQTTHLAARMEQMATPGTSCSRRHACSSRKGTCRSLPAGPVAVKGLPDPVNFVLTGARRSGAGSTPPPPAG